MLRLSQALPGSPRVQGVALAAGLLLLGAVCDWWTRGPLGLAPAGGHDRFLLVLFPVLTGYVLAIVPWGVRQSLLDLAALRPHLLADQLDGVPLEAHLDHHPTWMLVGAIACGLAIALATQQAIAGRVSLLLDGGATPRDIALLALAATFWIAALSGFAVVAANALFFSRVGDVLLRVDLLQRSASAPFARIALRYAGMIAGLLALQFLIAALGSESNWSPELREDALGAFALGAAFSLCVASLCSALALLLPCRGVHRATRREKSRVLEQIDRRIRERGDLLADAVSQAGERLPEAVGLLTLRERIAAVPEWPFDHFTRVRFAVLLMVPPASWVAAAAIENALFG